MKLKENSTFGVNPKLVFQLKKKCICLRVPRLYEKFLLYTLYENFTFNEVQYDLELMKVPFVLPGEPASMK